MQNPELSIELDDGFQQIVSIKVVGVGGAGGNAVNRMIEAGMKSVEFISMNTDAHALYYSKSTQKMQLGAKLTGGRGAGGNPEKGQKAAEESREDIENALRNAQIVFVTAGMGGGTGTGAAPVVAEIARSMGILTIGIVTKPFDFEGTARMRQAEEGIRVLRDHVDSLVIIPNDRLKLVSEQKLTFLNAFKIADDVLRQGVQSIADIINNPGLVNLDFEDISAVMRDAGNAHMGVGRGQGKDKAQIAADAAISSPLLETSINGARGVVISVCGPADMEYDDVELACSKVRAAAHPDANIIFGMSIDEKMEDEMSVTVIATGFEGRSAINVDIPFQVTVPEEEDPFGYLNSLFEEKPHADSEV